MHCFFSPTGIGRACARVDQLRSPFLDGAAPNDRRIPDRPGLRARTGRKTLAQACRSYRHRGFAQERRAALSFRGRYPRPVQTRSQVDGAAEAAGVGPGLLPGARHFRGRRHLLPLVLRRRASWTRSTPGAPPARPQPPMRAPQPPQPPHAPTPHLTDALHPPSAACMPRSHPTPFALMCVGAQFRPFYLGQGRGWRVEASRRWRRGPCGPGGARANRGWPVGLAAGGGTTPPMRGRRAVKAWLQWFFFSCHLWENPRR